MTCYSVGLLESRPYAEQRGAVARLQGELFSGDSRAKPVQPTGFFFCYHTDMLIKVRVRAGAKNDSVEKRADIYHISVRAKAAGGMANASVLTLLSREIGIPTKKLRITKGSRSPSKIVEIL